MYNTPIIDDALDNPGILATVLTTVGILHVARKIVAKKDEEQKPLWFKVLATVGIVGLASCLLKRFGSGAGIVGMKDANNSKKKPHDPETLPPPKDPTIDIRVAKKNDHTTVHDIRFGRHSRMKHAFPQETEERFSKKFRSSLRAYLTAIRNRYGKHYDPRLHTLRIIVTDDRAISSFVDRIIRISKELSEEFPECDLPRVTKPWAR